MALAFHQSLCTQTYLGISPSVYFRYLLLRVYFNIAVLVVSQKETLPLDSDNVVILVINNFDRVELTDLATEEEFILKEKLRVS